MSLKLEKEMPIGFNFAICIRAEGNLVGVLHLRLGSLPTIFPLGVVGYDRNDHF
jgi:hypothetical protein